MATALAVIRMAYNKAQLSPDVIEAESEDFLVALDILNLIIEDAANDRLFSNQKLFAYKKVVGIRDVLSVRIGTTQNISTIDDDQVRLTYGSEFRDVPISNRLIVQAAQGDISPRLICGFWGRSINFSRTITSSDLGGVAFHINVPHYPPPRELTVATDQVSNFISNAYLVRQLASELAEKDPTQQSLIPILQDSASAAYLDQRGRNNDLGPQVRRRGFGTYFGSYYGLGNYYNDSERRSNAGNQEN